MIIGHLRAWVPDEAHQWGPASWSISGLRISDSFSGFKFMILKTLKLESCDVRCVRACARLKLCC